MQIGTKQTSVAVLKLLLEELGDKSLEDSTDEVLAIQCIDSLMKRIIKAYGKNIDNINDKELCICALFVFILAEYIAIGMLDIDVEELTLMACISIFKGHQDSNRLMRMYKSSTESYNDFRRTQPKSMEFAITVLTGCVVGPDSERSLSAAPKVFELLVDCLV